MTTVMFNVSIANEPYVRSRILIPEGGGQRSTDSSAKGRNYFPMNRGFVPSSTRYFARMNSTPSATSRGNSVAPENVQLRRTFTASTCGRTARGITKENLARPSWRVSGTRNGERKVWDRGHTTGGPPPNRLRDQRPPVLNFRQNRFSP